MPGGESPDVGHRLVREAASGKALVLVTAVRGRRVVVAACHAARSHGVRPGLTLAEAQALCPAVAHADHDPDRDARGLAALGRHLMRFTPAVAVEPPASLFLDVTGCDRLFGGFDAILRQATEAVTALGLSAHVGIAPTPGAAWALAHTARVVTEEEVAAALAPLPPAALRIDPAAADALRTVGVDTVAQLVALPRESLPARFGAGVLERVDQATGRVAEPLAVLPPPSPVEAGMAFDGVVTSLEGVWAVLRVLVGRVTEDLARRGCGARHVRATFWCEGEDPVVRDVRLCRASRDAKQLMELLRCATDDARARDGFTAVEVAVPGVERVTETQARLIGRDPHDADAEVARLVERLRVRLPAGAVSRVRLVESHLPERAQGLVDPFSRPAGVPAPKAKRRAGPPAKREETADGVIRAVSVPLRLLPLPVEVRAVVEPSEEAEDARPAQFTHDGVVHRLAHAAGPHRVAGVWWTGHDKTRDYFDVVAVGGQRFWVFRVSRTRRWFLHGVFA